MNLRIARKVLKSAAVRGKSGLCPRHRRQTVLRALDRTRVQVTAVTIGDRDFGRAGDMSRAMREDTMRSIAIVSLLNGPKMVAAHQKLMREDVMGGMIFPSVEPYHGVCLAHPPHQLLFGDGRSVR